MKKIWQYHLDHWLFWLATVAFLAVLRIDLLEKLGWIYFAQELIIRNGLLAILIYGNLGYLMPSFLQKSKYLIYSLLLILCLLLYTAAKNAHDVYLLAYILGDVSKQGFLTNTYYNFSIAVFYLVFSVALQLSKEWFFQRELVQKIRLEKIQTELAYLKAQINPHFIFNMLNTIYFQIDKSNQTARDTLGQFADLLRYQLYDCHTEKIAISLEINYLQNYIQLQKIRKGEAYSIDFELAMPENNFEIAPLLLIPLLENAFKYVSHFQNRPNEIKIKLIKTGQLFHFQVFNTCENTQTKPLETTKITSGIGLSNVKRRLELLYNQQHSLEIKQEKDFFQVDLKIEIA
jgi:two-component system, LytTR family, sensor kinase